MPHVQTMIKHTLVIVNLIALPQQSLCYKCGEKIILNKVPF